MHSWQFFTKNVKEWKVDFIVSFLTKKIILMLFEINFQSILLTASSAKGWALKPIRAVVVQNVGDL